MEIESNSKEPDQFLNKIKKEKKMQKRNKREKKKDLNEASIIDTDHTFGMQSMKMAMNGKRQ